MRYGIPQAVAGDLPVAGVVRVDAQDRPAVAERIAGRADILRPQRATLVIGVVADVALAGINDKMVRPLARADIELTIGAEGDVVDRVGDALLAPVLDQHLLRPGGRRAGQVEARQATGGWAAGRQAARALVVPDRRGPADRRVIGVGGINVGGGGELRIERQARQAVVPVGVDLRLDVDR